MRKMMVVWMAAVMLAAFAGCGKKQTVSIDTTPFERAITAYLAQKQMGMKVADFKELNVNGDKAEAICSMKEASGMYGVAVKWSFSFEKNDGEWVVSGLKQ